MQYFRKKIIPNYRNTKSKINHFNRYIKKHNTTKYLYLVIVIPGILNWIFFNVPIYDTIFKKKRK